MKNKAIAEKGKDGPLSANQGSEVSKADYPLGLQWR